MGTFGSFEGRFETSREGVVTNFQPPPGYTLAINGVELDLAQTQMEGIQIRAEDTVSMVPIGSQGEKWT